MSDPEAISHAYLEAHPADAARVLERVAPHSVAAMLQETPTRLCAPVLRAMLPLRAASCLKPLPDAVTAGFLRALGAQAGAAVLRHFPAARLSVVLAQLPSPTALAFRLLLSYPQDSVGAWMDPDALALPEDIAADEALARVREATEQRCEFIFVTGAQQRLLGRVPLAGLLRCDPGRTLGQILSPVRHGLSARATIHRISEDRDWQEYQTLPVVERGDRMVGVLDRVALARGLAREREVPMSTAHNGVTGALAGGYWVAVSGLIEAVVTLIPTADRPAPGDAERRA